MHEGIAELCSWAGSSLLADAAAGTTSTYRLLDHEGTLAMATDASGNMLGTNVFAPYGQAQNEQLGNAQANAQFWIGLFQDAEYTGNAAWYRDSSARAARWLTPDPDNGNYNTYRPQSRYMYVNGNPMGDVDPSGEAGAGILTGIGGNLCLGYSFSGINPCSPLISAFATTEFVPYLSFVTTFACGFASSSDAKSTFCGQSGLTGLFSKDHPDLAMGINDAVALTQLVDSLAIAHLAGIASTASIAAGGGSISSGAYLWSCVSGTISNPACDVAIALIVYATINDILSVIEDFFGSPRFTGSLLPRPSALGGLGTAPIRIPNQNLSVPRLLGQASRSVVPSPEPLFSATKQ